VIVFLEKQYAHEKYNNKLLFLLGIACKNKKDLKKLVKYFKVAIEELPI